MSEKIKIELTPYDAFNIASILRSIVERNDPSDELNDISESMKSFTDEVMSNISSAQAKGAILKLLEKNI